MFSQFKTEKYKTQEGDSVLDRLMTSQNFFFKKQKNYCTQQIYS